MEIRVTRSWARGCVVWEEISNFSGFHCRVSAGECHVVLEVMVNGTIKVEKKSGLFGREKKRRDFFFAALNCGFNSILTLRKLGRN
jgi:hypothetical protein